jgi:large subunit ribosomal protein L22
MAEIKQVSAISRGVAMAPRKISLVASLVRGRSVADALVILQYTPKRAAKPIAKTIASAKANAVNTHGIDEKSLIIDSLQIGHGARLKRFRPAARGRAAPYQKRTSHIHVVVSGQPKPKKKPSATKTTVKNASKETK